MRCWWCWISEQFPNEVAEQRKRLLPQLKEAREAGKNTTLSVDKLIVDGKVIQRPTDMRVCDINLDITEEAQKVKMKNTDILNEMGSSFQGHAVTVKGPDDIQPSLTALYKNAKVARATHNIYAYRIKCGNVIVENACDDGEHGASARMLKLLQDKGVENLMVIVTRWKAGPNMGKRRFAMIEEAAKQALMKVS